MTFLVKLLLGATVVVASSSIATVVTLREYIFSGLSREISELTSRCYVIPTEQSDNLAQLLACHHGVPESSSVSEYLLYSRKGNREVERIKKINKEVEQLKISLEGLADEEFNLKVTKDVWSGINSNTGINLQEACSLVTDSGELGGTKWQCNREVASEEVSIPLSNFQG